MTGGAGASPQRPLWASTGTKDPATPTSSTWSGLSRPASSTHDAAGDPAAFADHRSAEPTLGRDPGEALAVLSAAAAEGVDLDAIAAELERDGVQAFCDSYAELLRCIEGKRSALGAVS